MKIYMVMAMDMEHQNAYVMECFVTYEDAEAYKDEYERTVENHLFYVMEKDLWGQGTTVDEITEKHFAKNL